MAAAKFWCRGASERRARRRWLRAASAAAALLACGGAAADASARLQALLDGMQSYAADFEQVVAGANGEALQTVTGSMQVQRPGLFRWEALPPYPQLIVADGAQLYVFDPDLEQVTVQPAEAFPNDSPARLLASGAAAVAELFAVRGEASRGAEVESFVLAPKDDASLFRSIRLVFAAARLERLEIADALEQSTRIAFRNIRLNPALPPDSFRFEPPAGVDVVGAGAPPQ